MSSSEPSSANDSLREHLERSLSGAYRVDRELGGGGMARVFVAEEQALGRQVVVKVLSPELAHALSTERFTREIKLSARLQHPNIVPVLTAGVAGDVPYYTMPFIEGESLRARLSRLGVGERLPFFQAIDLLRDVARALAYAHSLGVVHRDIKPENVLLGFDAAVVADFGVAKAVAAARAQVGGTAAGTLTQGGVALGTPAYMSPEQAAGDPNVDHRADVYAWGVVAYEVLAGAHPFAGHHSIQSLVTAHLVEQPRALNEVAPLIPGPVSALVMRCLAKDPEQRPANAREILEALPTNISGEVLPSVQPVVASRKRSSLRTVGIGLAVVAASIGGIFLASRASGKDSPASPAVTTTASPSASDAYLRAKVLVSAENPGDNDAAIAALREATALDPTFAPAFAELARAYGIKGFYFAPDSEKKKLREDAEVALARAFQLDGNLAEAYFARGLLLWIPARRFPHEQAIQAYRQALARNPKLDEAHHQLGVVLLHIGLFDEAQAEIEQALAINPANTLALNRLGLVDLYRGNYAAAYRIFRSTPPDWNPTLTAFQTATALWRLGRDSEATTLLDRYLHDYPTDEGGVGTSVRAMMLAKAGRRAEAEAAIAKSIEVGQAFGHFHHTAYNVASAYALLGENEKAIAYLEDAADNGFPCYPLFARDSLLDGLRKEPRFVALMTRLESEWSERKRTLGSSK